MIKLFATDMDHTLLDDDSKLPPNFKETVDRIQKNDLHLILASGRTLVSIKHKVKDYIGKLSFISDNGAIVEYDGEIQYIDAISKEDIKAIIEISRKSTECSIIAASINSAYIELDNESHREYLSEYYPDYNIVEDITKVDDDIVKITLMSENHSTANYNEFVKDKQADKWNVLQSGKVWIDVMNKGIDKGNGLKHLIDKVGINAQEIVAFGDYHNDIGMLELAGHSYAVMNAHDDVKAIADSIIAYNYDNAVMNTINELIDKEK